MADGQQVYAALAAVMEEVQSVAKKDRNTHSNYNFRGIDAVMNAVGPALRKHQVVVVPQLDTVTYETVETSRGKSSTACRVEVTYLFFAADGSCLATKVAGEAWDSGDKACPKAMSVAFRTALLQSLCLPTDEADADESTYERAPAQAAAPVETVPPLDDFLGAYPDLFLETLDLDKTRAYAAQSGAHLSKALEQLEAKHGEWKAAQDDGWNTP